MKGLNRLVRLQKTKLDERQRHLSSLQAVVAGFKSDIDSLDTSMRSESDSAVGDGESAQVLGLYLQGAIVRRETLCHSLAEMTDQVRDAEREVAEAYRALKKCEILEEKQMEQARLKRNRRDRRVEDELAAGIMERQKQAATA